MPDTSRSHSPIAGSAAVRARLLSRWIGTGIGVALLITVLVLAFSFDCVTSAQSNVLAVVLALGAATLLWGIVGGLKVDLKLKFKALGEVAAGGVAAIFLVVHVVSSRGIIPAEDGCPPVVVVPPPKPDKQYLYGKVFLQGAETKAVQQATVKVEMADVVDRFTDDDGSFDVIIPSDVTQVRVWVMKEGFSTSIAIDAELPLVRDKLRIPMVRLVVSGESPPVTDFPTFVEEWDDALVEADVPSYENAEKVSKADALALANWGRRAHAAKDYEWSTRFFEAAKRADPAGKAWVGDLPYMVSAYDELGRKTKAKTARQDLVDAIYKDDPRLNPASIRDMGPTYWKTFDTNPLPAPIMPWFDPRGPIMPGFDPKVPIQPIQPILPGVPGVGEPMVPFQPIGPAVGKPKAPVQPGLDPTAPTAQPTAPMAQPVEPIRLERGVRGPLVQPKPLLPSAEPKASPKTPVGG